MKFYYGGSVFGPEDARTGHAPAQFMVAEMHRQGQGVPQDYAAAWAWFRLALEQGYQLAGDSLYELESKLSPQQRQEGKARLASYRQEIGDLAVQ